MSVTCRPDGGGSTGRKTELDTNFFNIGFDYDVTVYFYDVQIFLLFDKKDGSKGTANAKKKFKV